MPQRRYDASRQALFTPGAADDFFQARPGPWRGAALAAEMARLAYVKERSRTERYLARQQFTLVRPFEAEVTQAFLAERDDLGVLAFRGTEADDPTDLFTDGKFLQIPWFVDGAPRGSVHGGFARALGHVWSDVAESLNGIAKPLVFTGHSLGAALATLAASSHRPARLYTFGSPRVGDPDFVRGLEPVAHERYVDCCDIVTRVPPEGSVPVYQHAGTLMYIDSAGAITATPPPDKVEADRRQASLQYLAELGFLAGRVPMRELADHALINYVWALA
jgi:hypothetical protein